MEPNVYIVLVNYNGANDTKECVDSLLKLNYRNFKILVVDNGSTEASDLNHQINHPLVTLIKSKENLGFAGANNLGIRIALGAGADAVWMLNNDTIVTDDCLKEMVEVLYREPDTGIVCPKILYYSQPDTIWFAGGKLNWLKGNTHHIGQHRNKDMKQETEMDVNFATGCSLLIKREVFHSVGVLREDYFLYYEDTEFCCRVTKRSYAIKYRSDIIIYHKVSASTSANGLKIYYMTRNNLMFMWRNVNKLVFLLFMLFFVKKNLTYIKGLFMKVPEPHKNNSRMFLLGCKHFIQGKKGKYKAPIESPKETGQKSGEKAAL
ncbi:glycosyltransferase family 2 protein [Paenibacillus sp. sptzw28]|uniref:glycosyltransferase family 2 protein n=1 Tax=Paenibacillus sp. sptzw28 TaxID=715179 RepID=UPI001C6E92F5|nr:glycosyltransferase family 2 protein [Paenibacillus sp. sptzw28]QYR20621.1 glycosyltransferase family 2 protein [Paenibacillus sp. sptzw28]